MIFVSMLCIQAVSRVVFCMAILDMLRASLLIDRLVTYNKPEDNDHFYEFSKIFENKVSDSLISVLIQSFESLSFFLCILAWKLDNTISHVLEESRTQIMSDALNYTNENFVFQIQDDNRLYSAVIEGYGTEQYHAETFFIFSSGPNLV
jgi:hypothetical protein